MKHGDVSRMIRFTVPGEPVAQGRPKFTTKSGFPRAYDPEKSRSYKEYVRYTAAEYAPDIPFDGPLVLTIDVYRSIPKSFSKKKIIEAENRLLRPITKPDGSNYQKLIEDAMNGIIWRDDSQLVDIWVSKWYSILPRVEITVKEWGEESV